MKTLLSRVYDEVHMGLWAILIAGLIFFGVFGLPAMTSDQAGYAAARAHVNETEDAFYCRRWGLIAGSGKHRTCMSDLEQLRRSVEKQMAYDSVF